MNTSTASISITTTKWIPKIFELFVELVKIELKTRYKNTLLGVYWFALYPSLIAASFIAIRVIFFHKFEIGKISLIDFYLLLILWIFFVMSAQNSIDCFTRNPKFISNLKLPVFLVPLSIVVVYFMATLVNVMFYFMILCFFKKKLFPHFIEFIPVLFVSFIFVSSLCIVFAFLQKFLPDLRLIFPYLTRLGLVWLPIFYDLNFIPESIRAFYKNIPFVWAILRTREMFSGNIYASISSSLNMVLFSLILFILIVYIVRKLEHYALSVGQETN